MGLTIKLFLLNICTVSVCLAGRRLFDSKEFGGLECNFRNSSRRAIPESQTDYLYCSLSGTWVQRKCAGERVFDRKLLECRYAETFNRTLDDYNDLFAYPLRQTVGVCGTGTPAFQNGGPLICNPNVNSCPAGFTCSIYSITGVYYCCSGNLQSSVCGTGTPLLQGGSPVLCQQNVPTCPTGYQCRVYSPTSVNYCCSAATTTAGCPTGSNPLLIGGATQTCSPAVPNQCPTGYSCQLNPLTLVYQCCTLPASSNGCPAGQISYIDVNSNQPLACSPPPSINSCPNGFGCIFSGAVQRYQCCGQSFGCPFNSAALINPNSGSFTTCNIGGSCQTGFQCVTSTVLNQPICCSTPSSTTNPLLCPNGQSPFMVGSTAQQCSQPSTACPNGYLCTNVNGQNVCCPSAVQCPVGTPLPGVTCTAQNPCQAGYDCTITSTGSFCCPNEITACTQPLQTGTGCANAAVQTRYYFDTSTASCTSFQYNNCPGAGNLNNFITSTACETFCLKGMCSFGTPLRQGIQNQACSVTTNSCPQSFTCQAARYGPPNSQICCPAAANVCSQSLVTGSPCVNGATGSVTRYYFNFATKTCQQFQYAGCAGNDNNFKSQQQCQSYCGTTVCPAGSPLVDPAGVFQQCSTTVTCPTGFDCIINGAQSSCCPSPSQVCSRQQDAGQQCPGGSVSTTKYFFNPQTRTCQQFSYFGCGGNGNRFDSLQLCQSFCASAVSVGTCPSGLAPYITPGQTAPQPCTINVGTSCVPGYTCLPGTQGAPLCCQGVPTCPNNAAPYIPAGGNSAQLCTAGTINGCPTGYNCQPSTLSAVSICCQNQQQVINTCPNNLNTNQQACTRVANDQCPVGFTCLIGTNGAGICCQSAAQCPSNQAPFIPNGGQKAQICGGVSTPCPSTHPCTGSTLIGVSVCCAPVVNSLCPSGLSPNGQQCAVNSIGSCPPNFICLPNPTNLAQGQCCAGAPACLNGIQPFYVPGSANQIQICTSGVSTCQSGSFCSASSISGVSVCCAQNQQQVGLQCPTGFVAYLQPGTNQARTCAPTAATCPQGYVCLTSTTGSGNVCCGNTAAVQCAGNLQAYVNPASGQKQFCNPQSANACPVNNQCYSSTMFSQYLCCGSPGSTSSAVCLNGGSPFLLPGTNTQQTCSLFSANVCQNGYVCQQSTNGQFFCCSTLPIPTIAQCPSGSNPALLGNVPLNCSPGSTCPNGFSCVQSTLLGQFLCCSPTSSGAGDINVASCSVGAPYIQPGTSNRLVCSPGAINSCPSGSTCTSSTNYFNLFICCIPGVTTNTGTGGTPSLIFADCSSGAQPYILPGTTWRRTCSVFGSSCPSGYSCQSSTRPNTMICCQAQGVTQFNDYCPSLHKPLLTSSAQPLECLPNVGNNCAFGYTCTRNINTGKSYCCSPNGFTADSGICPGESEVYNQPANNAPLTCSPSIPNSCPFGYTCLPSQGSLSQFYCCSDTGALPLQGYCESGQSVYVQPGSTVPNTCSPVVGTTCPTPYACVFSRYRFQYYCCVSGVRPTVVVPPVEDGCPQGTRAFISGFTQNPLTCIPSTNSCPSGFSCRFSIPFFRYQCCTNSGFRAAKTVARDQSSFGKQINEVSGYKGKYGCPSGYAAIAGQCLQLLSPGESGCTHSEQCGLREPGAACSGGYCVCPSHLLVHNKRCSEYCPNLYINIAGRCISTRALQLTNDDMAEIGKHKNGTVGGWCLNTVIKGKQCTVGNSTCSLDSLTCVCIDAYELDLNNIHCIPIRGYKVSKEEPSDSIKRRPSYLRPVMDFVSDPRKLFAPFSLTNYTRYFG